MVTHSITEYCSKEFNRLAETNPTFVNICKIGLKICDNYFANNFLKDIIY